MAATIIGSLERIILQLYELGAIKFAEKDKEFTLKSGIQSPVYFNLRVLNSNPKLREEVSELIWHACQMAVDTTFDCVCGVPLGAISYADCMSLTHNLPLVLKRPYRKRHGVSKELVDSDVPQGSNCLVVEDVVTTAGSVSETIEALKDAGYVVTNAVTFIDRDQGGKQRLQKEYNVTLSSVCTAIQALDILFDNQKLTKEVKEHCHEFLKTSYRSHQNIIGNHKKLRYKIRAEMAKNSVAKKLFYLMENKYTNLVVSADVNSMSLILELARRTGPYICAFKIHIDAIDMHSYEYDRMKELRKIADRDNFLLIHDCKYADIGSTVYRQYIRGFRVLEWADLVTVHAISGPGVIEALKKACGEKERGCLLIAQMSTEGNLISEEYTEEVIKMAVKHDDFVAGFISREKISPNPGFLHMTPGVHIEKNKKGDLGQQYLTLEQVLLERESDIMIVGSAIYDHDSPQIPAKEMKEKGYEAYVNSL